MREYFQIVDDFDLSGRWCLNGLFDASGTEFDSREFTYAKRFELRRPIDLPLYGEEKRAEAKLPLRMSLRRSGSPADFTLADFDVPVVTAKVANILLSITESDVQTIPLNVDSIDGEYVILNVTCQIPCIDTDASEIQWYEPNNDVRPDLAGKPEMITKLVIDPARADPHDIFRPDGWEVVVVVSDRVRDALERAEVSGIKYRKVTI